MSSSSDRIRVWDLPTRIFHWSLAVLVVFSFTTGKIGGGWMEWHLKSGYAILALLIFRLAWGAVGSRTARFASFLRGPAAAWTHARELFASRYVTVIGHNPLGGWMVVVLIAVLLLQAATGLFADDEIATQGPLAVMVSNALVDRMSAIHAYNSWVIVGAVAVHVLAIVLYRWRFKVDLTSPMLYGWRSVPPDIRRPDPSKASPALALIALACAAAFVYWLVAIFPKGA